VSAGTRWQWPPVYGDFSSIAVLMSAMKDSNSTSSWLMRCRLVSAYGGLGGERFRETLVGRSERPAPVGARLLTVDQLQHADDFAFVVLHSAR